jgi:aspartyl-tRNA(Asn)/glutamyl-tRNA(Gln) amidotransferase subunit B
VVPAHTVHTVAESMTPSYEAVIGLEVHAQLKTTSKAFCSCSATFGAKPNVNTCPVCLGHPGTLPVLNEHLITFAVRMGLATNCSIRPTSTFSRKNYFYADLPKGYQISQYQDPICYDGHVEIELDESTTKRIGITRIHMEEDSGKSIHDLDIDTLVDLNRAGVPLIEIVSEPDIRSPREAYLYLQQLRQTLMYLDICDGNMEEGSLRCDANVSVRPVGRQAFGTKTEVKNLNSFRNVEKALEYEIQRQISLILEGGSVVQETMMWDAGAQQTRTMRSKEQAHDYRYFPEPDLPHVQVTEQLLEELRITLPELGLQKKGRFRTQYGLPAYDAGILVEDAAVAAYYEAAVGHLRQPSVETYKQVSNWIMTEILRVMGEKKVAIGEVGLSPLQLASLVNVVADGVISSKTAKDILPELYASEQTADQIVEAQGLRQMSDEGALQAIVDDILAANPENVEKYREGKTKLLGFFVGQVLKATDGTANPTIATALMKAALDGPLDK